LSGIVGIWNMNGAPVDRQLLGRMTDFMTFRGPDTQQIWVDSANPSIGFGHTLLKTTFESEFERQPFTLDGKVWIVADARVDAQDDLMSKLNAKPDATHRNIDWLTDPRNIRDSRPLATGHRPPATDFCPPAPGPQPLKKGSFTDVELILRAYHLWGEDGVHHLLGDFAFAIWDGPKQKLFCARDHMGVKPFYYAHIEQTLIFSNTLDCVRLHPKVSDELNDLAIADFLLFDLNQDPATTSFEHIQRIPPAHSAVWSSSGSQVRRYWTLPIDEPVYRKRDDDYTDQFNHLLVEATSDRLRIDRVGLLLSGGIDSPTLAVATTQLLSSRGKESALTAYTFVNDGPVPDRERYYAGLVASQLRIRVEYREIMNEELMLPNPKRAPEPYSDPFRFRADNEFYGQIAKDSRVVFYGEGPDNALYYEWSAYLKYLCWNQKWLRLGRDLISHSIHHRRLPLVPGIFRYMCNRFSEETCSPSLPVWINQSFVNRLNLRDRWNDSPAPTTSGHPVRPIGHGSLVSSMWQLMFDNFDAGVTQTPLEFRHPFLDLRLIRFMLSVPALPWCRAKYLLRLAARDELPDEVLRRPKAPLSFDPTYERVRRFGLPSWDPSPRLEEYVKLPDAIPTADDEVTHFGKKLSTIGLGCWLDSVQLFT
jgi:asparagine synthase (glutamine-hydrolysing)